MKVICIPDSINLIVLTQKSEHIFMVIFSENFRTSLRLMAKIY